MQKFDWKDIAELTGIATIVASLIFVGLQMKQSQDIAIAEQYQARAIAAAESMRWRVGNESMHEDAIIATNNHYASGEGGEVFNNLYESRGPEYLAARYYRDLSRLVTLDSYHLQYQLGTMNDESWTVYRYRIKRFLRDEYSRFVFTADPQAWRESFQSLCFELIAEIEEEEALAGQHESGDSRIE